MKLYRNAGQDGVSRTNTVAFVFFVSELWPFDCVCTCMVIRVINILVHSITHTLFMISSSNFIRMFIR